VASWSMASVDGCGAGWMFVERFTVLVGRITGETMAVVVSEEEAAFVAVAVAVVGAVVSPSSSDEAYC